MTKSKSWEITSLGGNEMPENYTARWDYFSRKASAFAAGTTLADEADPDENVLRALGPRAGIATLVSNTIVSTTESIITATKVMNDTESSHGEKAAAALRCFSGVSMLVAFTGPTGLAAGTAISAVLAMITELLDAYAGSDGRKTELKEFEKLLKDLRLKEKLSAIKSAQFLQGAGPLFVQLPAGKYDIYFFRWGFSDCPSMAALGGPPRTLPDGSRATRTKL
jgi:hypothetical protein